MSETRPTDGDPVLHPEYEQSLLLYVMYSVLVADSSIAGTMLTRDESGPIASPGMLPSPWSMAAFPKTHVDAPWKDAAFRKSLKEIANLSVLTPIFG